MEEVEQAASLVQQAVHPDALTIFGATFDETLDDEIRVTVIATGFDKPTSSGNNQEDKPKQPQNEEEGQHHHNPPEPTPLDTADDPEPDAPEDDPFEDIFKIFNKRD